MIQFRCKRSGNILRVTQVDDIVAMRKHESYEEVFDAPVAEGSVDVPAVAPAEKPKRRGRPPGKVEELVI